MGIVNFDKFGFDAIKAKARQRAEEARGASDQELVRWLSYIGEELCNHARTITPDHSTGGYDDQTGNLRSSIGYRVFKNGEPVKDGGFKNVKEGNGIEEAKDALERYGLAHDIPVDGWTLVIVAGMSYATYVEAKGYNVLHLTKAEMYKKIEELKKELGL